MVEMVLAIAVIGIVAALVGPSLLGGVKGYSIVAKRSGTLNSARLAMERFSQEAALIPSAAAIDTWQALDFQFDISTEDNVRYWLNGSNFQRGAGVLCDGVTSATFTYLDADGAVAANVNDIKRIVLELRLSAGSGTGELRLRTAVYPRQLSNAYADFK